MYKHASLSLCCYDLAHSLHDSPEDIARNQAQFLQRLPASISLDLNKATSSHFVLLADNNLTSKGYIQQEDSFYYPLLISKDCFALLFDSEHLQVDLTALGAWQQQTASLLKTQVRQPLDIKHKGFMGQTWVFSALVENAADLGDIAQSTYQALRGTPMYLNDVPVCYPLDLGGGAWFVFEEQGHEVWIGLYQDKAALDSLGNLWDSLILLWSYQHKISWSYAQAQSLKQVLKDLAAKIKGYHDEIQAVGTAEFDQDSLKHTLTRAWQDLVDCRQTLRTLDDQRRTIEINQYNYQAQFQDLGLDAAVLALKAKAHQHHYNQVDFDYANLQPEQALLENLIDYIRTLVALEDTELQRRQNRLIAVWGGALTLGAIVASISAQFPLWFGSQWLQSLLLSIGAAGLIGLLMFAWKS